MQQQQSPSLSNSPRPLHQIPTPILAGALSGIVSTLVVHPLDVIRIRIQYDTKLSQTLSSTTITATTTTMKKNTIFDIIRNIIIKPDSNSNKFTGWGRYTLKPLYKGILIPVTAQGFYKASVFTILTSTTSYLKKPDNSLIDTRAWSDFKVAAVAGAVAGGVNAFFIVTPVEYFRSYVILNDFYVQPNANARVSSNVPLKVKANVSANKRIKSIVKTVRRSYRGAFVTTTRDAIGCSAFFFTFSYVKSVLLDYQNRDLPSSLQAPPPPLRFGSLLMAGGLSGCNFWIFALPFDTIKTLVQSSSTSSSLASTNKNNSQIQVKTKPLTALQWTFKLIHSDPTKLYRGLSVCFMRGVPGAGITLGGYDVFSRYIDDL